MTDTGKTKPPLESSKSSSKLQALFGKEVKQAPAPEQAAAVAGGIVSRDREIIKGWVRKWNDSDISLPGRGLLQAQKRYLKMQASWEGEGSIVKYYTDAACTATSYRGTIRLKTVTNVIKDPQSTTKFLVETPKRTYKFEACDSGPTRDQWIQMWSDNTNFDEAKKTQQLLLAQSGNQEDSAGITRPTPDQLALPKPKRVPRPAAALATNKTATNQKRDGNAPLTRDVEDKLSSYEKQIAELKSQLASALNGKVSSPRATSPRTARYDPAEERKKQERLAVLLEMGVVSKEEYVEKLSDITSPKDGMSPISSNPASGASSPKARKRKNETKVAKLNELLSMSVITQEEYDERLAKIKVETKVAKLNELLSMDVITQEQYDERLTKIKEQAAA